MLTEAQIGEAVARALEGAPFAGQRVLVLIPDATRTFPVPLFFRLIADGLRGRARQVNFMVALGTHPPMSEAALLALVGLTAADKQNHYPDVGIFNHAWDDPDALVLLGTLAAEEIAVLSGGRLREEVPVRLNRMVLACDHLLVCGPVFPHEVVGFSGGNKYFLPGIAGADIINFTHWLGALVTSRDLIGKLDTPVRRVIDRAVQLIPRPRHALCSVITHAGVEGVFWGTPEVAYQAAAQLSAQHHIVWTDRPYRQVLSVLPAMYDEIWVGAKGMYKMEPAMADGGEVILYGPHIHQISQVHGELIRQVGYHVRDYFVKQWERFSHIPGGILAHSTHLRGAGTFEGGIERPRIQVTLATAIPESECRAVNLGYRDPGQINPESFGGREEEGVLLIPRAGEYLHRLRVSQ